MRDDVIDLAAGDGALDQSPGSSGPEAMTPELRGDFVADLDSAVDRPGGEATRAEQPVGCGPRSRRSTTAPLLGQAEPAAATTWGISVKPPFAMVVKE